MIPTLDEARERRLPLAGQVLARTDFSVTEYGESDHEIVRDLADANLITSMIDTGDPISRLGDMWATHRVVIDIDLPVAAVESSTPGHFHLYIDKAMDWPTYLALLEAFVSAGIVEPGYLAAAQRRGHTAVRLPWVHKPEPAPLPVLPSLADCTHGDDCTAHPGTPGVHDFNGRPI
jgi:hypothetical protein